MTIENILCLAHLAFYRHSHSHGHDHHHLFASFARFTASIKPSLDQGRMYLYCTSQDQSHARQVEDYGAHPACSALLYPALP